MAVKFGHAFACAALFFWSGLQAQAADYLPPSEPPAESGWTFIFAPYLWGAGLKGDVGLGLSDVPPQDIDVSFSDILKNFDIGAMAVAEARNERFFLGADLLYLKLGTDINTPFGVVFDSIDVTEKFFMGTGFAGYSIFYEPGVNLDVFAGARVWSSTTEFDFNGGNRGGTSADDSETWVDPLIGIKGRADLGSDFYLTGWGMIGGFGVSSDFMWDVLGGLGYEFNDTFSMIAGYRAAGVDYENDGYVLDVVFKGPILGFAFHF